MVLDSSVDTFHFNFYDKKTREQAILLEIIKANFAIQLYYCVVEVVLRLRWFNF